MGIALFLSTCKTMIMDRPIIYPQKKEVRRELRKRFRSAMDESNKIPDAKPLDKYKLVANEYYRGKIEKFYNCVDFCLESKLITMDEFKTLKRRMEIECKFSEEDIKPI